MYTVGERGPRQPAGHKNLIITIPRELAKKLGIQPGDKLTCEQEGESLVYRKKEDT